METKLNLFIPREFNDPWREGGVLRPTDWMHNPFKGKNGEDHHSRGSLEHADQIWKAMMSQETPQNPFRDSYADECYIGRGGRSVECVAPTGHIISKDVDGCNSFSPLVNTDREWGNATFLFKR